MLAYNEMLTKLYENHLKEFLFECDDAISVQIDGIDSVCGCNTIRELFDSVGENICIEKNDVPFFYDINEDKNNYNPFLDDYYLGDGDDGGNDKHYEPNDKIDWFINPRKLENSFGANDINFDFDDELKDKLLYLVFIEKLADRAISDLGKLIEDKQEVENKQTVKNNQEIGKAIRKALASIKKGIKTPKPFLCLVFECFPLTQALAPLLITIAEIEYKVCINGLRDNLCNHENDSSADENNALLNLEYYASPKCIESDYRDGEINDIVDYFKTIVLKIIKRLSERGGNNLKLNESTNNAILPLNITINENRDKLEDFSKIIRSFRMNLFLYYNKNYDFPDPLICVSDPAFMDADFSGFHYNISLMCFMIWRSSNIGKSRYGCFNNVFGYHQYFVDIELMKWIKIFEKPNEYKKITRVPKTKRYDDIKPLYKALNIISASRLVLFEKLSTVVGQELEKVKRINWSSLFQMKERLHNKCLHTDNFINFEYNQFSRYSILDVLDYFEIIDMYRKCRKDHLDQQDH